MSGSDVVGVIPAAGSGSRLGIDGSKEVVEVGGRPIIAHLLDRLASAGIDEAVIVLRAGKEDIPAALAGNDAVPLAYVTIDESPSELDSVAAGVATVEGVVALGYPDVLFEPDDAYAALLERLRETGADLVLGIFPTTTPDRVDMVALDDAGRPVEVVIKQPDRGLRYSWSIAVWGPRFGALLVDTAVEQLAEEASVGDVVQAAIGAGLAVEAVRFDDGAYLDVGTPEDLARARRTY